MVEQGLWMNRRVRGERMTIERRMLVSTTRFVWLGTMVRLAEG